MNQRIRGDQIPAAFKITTGLLVIFALIFSTGTGCSSDKSESELRHTIAQEMEQEMVRKLDVWYPRVIDHEYGGYLSNFSYNWEQEDSQNKMIVTQARHLWTLSKTASRFSDQTEYSDYAAHGFDFLKNKMWDDQYGGFYQIVTREGEPIRNSQFGEDFAKTLYGNAFAIYGLAAYYGATQNPDALDLAKETFYWLDTHSHDPVYGGYFQPLARDGTPDKNGYPKDYNSGIHILEALTELYIVWPDETVRDRLSEMFTIVRDTMVTDEGFLKLYFSEDWTHQSYRDSTESAIMENIGRDHITPGHDIETAYLLLEAAHALGLEGDPETERIAKKMTDHTIETGWDSETGGFYDTGYYFPGDDELTIIRDSKNWWAQAEGLNTLLIMANNYPDDPHNYFEKFVKQWEYMNEYLIDHEYGGWYSSGLDKSPQSDTALKSQIWKGNYHTIRALMSCLDKMDG